MLSLPLERSPRGTSPAILQGRSDTSQHCTPRMPDSALIRRRQTSPTPTPRGVTSPRPVTTTRRIRCVTTGGGDRSASISGILLDEGDRVLHGQDLLGGIVGNLAAEFLLERHDQLDRIEAVRAEIVDEARALGYLRLIDAKMLDDDLLHALGDVTHSSRSPMNCIAPAVAAAGDRAVAGAMATRPPAGTGKRGLLT